MPGGSRKQLIETIVTTRWPLGNDITFIPDHGNPSTFAHERANSMFVSERALEA